MDWTLDISNELLTEHVIFFQVTVPVLLLLALLLMKSSMPPGDVKTCTFKARLVSMVILYVPEGYNHSDDSETNLIIMIQ